MKRNEKRTTKVGKEMITTRFTIDCFGLDVNRKPLPKIIILKKCKESCFLDMPALQIMIMWLAPEIELSLKCQNMIKTQLWIVLKICPDILVSLFESKGLHRLPSFYLKKYV